MRAADLALFYQALLHNPGEMWKPDVLADATGNVRNHLPERMTGIPANRTLGLVQAGDDGLATSAAWAAPCRRGAFGHNGAGGQIAWADPATGLSRSATAPTASTRTWSASPAAPRRSPASPGCAGRPDADRQSTISPSGSASSPRSRCRPSGCPR